MRWCVIRHPDLGLAVVAEPSLVVHRPRGWVRVSEFVADRDTLRVERYADAPDLDAEQPNQQRASQAAEQPAPTESAEQTRPAGTKSTKATAGKRDN